MAVVETAGSIGSTLQGTFFAILLAGIVGYLVYRHYSGQKKYGDGLKEEYKISKEDAKTQLPDNMRFLYRCPLPFLGDFIAGNIKAFDVGKIKADTDVVCFMNHLRSVFEPYRKSIYLGKIIGFSRGDIKATIEDLLMPEGKLDDPFKVEDETKEALVKEKEKAIAELRELLRICGRYINLIIFEPDKKPVLAFQREDAILCFDDQILGIESEDGVIAVLGQGLDRVALYWYILAGYPDRAKVILTHIVTRGWLRWILRLEAIHIESTEEAMRLDSATAKAIILSAVQNKQDKGDKKL